jgi:ATP-dependent HslUV protease ATP-binding subunit HslU
MVRKIKMEEVREKARIHAEDRLLEILVPSVNPPPGSTQASEEASHTREKFREKLRAGDLDDKMVEVEVAERGGGAMVEFFPVSGMESMDINIKDMLSNMMPKRQKLRKMKVAEALEILRQEEAEQLIDMDDVSRLAVQSVEQNGIVFLDEVDKIVGRSQATGPDVSREGVQRDLLPIVEGSTVATKYGPVRTDHILFIAAGAFHVAKPSDMIPELQGRFPIRVELKPLTKDDFILILTEPKNALIKQYILLLETEEVELEFTPEAIEELAAIAYQVNSQNENIGARRLHTILEKTVEDISFEAPTLNGQTIKITPEYIREQLGAILEDQDLSRYIL